MQVNLYRHTQDKDCTRGVMFCKECVMANDTDKILAAITQSSEDLHTRLNDHEVRLRNVETAITVQGLKVGAILVLIVTVAGSISSLIVNNLDKMLVTKWWSSQ